MVSVAVRICALLWLDPHLQHPRVPAARPGGELLQSRSAAPVEKGVRSWPEGVGGEVCSHSFLLKGAAHSFLSIR